MARVAGRLARAPGHLRIDDVLLLLFPDGRLISPRWRPVAWFVASGVTLAAVLAFSPELDRRAGFPNPVAPGGPAGDFMLDLAHVTDLLAMPAAPARRAALAVRFRRSRGVERLQLKWFTYPSAIVGVGLGLSTSAPGVVADVGFLVGLLALARCRSRPASRCCATASTTSTW